MATTRFIDHLLEGDHASRPAASAVPQGTLYSCTTHSLVYQSDGTSTWSTWATLGGSSDLDAIIAASSGQDIADALAGANAPDAGNVFATMADVGGGGNTIYYPSLKPGTPDFDFTGNSLSGWTAVSTAGSFTTSTCYSGQIDGSYLSMNYYNQNGFIYQSASNVDQDLIVGGIISPFVISGADHFFGCALLDTSNNGAAAIYHLSDHTCAVIKVTAGVFDGATAQTTSTAWGFAIGTPTRLFMKLTRATNAWTTSVSLDGANWNETTSSISNTVTVARRAVGSFGNGASGYKGAFLVDYLDTP